MAYVTLAELDLATRPRRKQSTGKVRSRRAAPWGMGQVNQSCFMALPTNTASDEAQRRWLAMTEDQRTALRAPYIAQIKASVTTTTDDQAKIQAEQRAVNDILVQVNAERANPRLCSDVIRSLFYSTLGSPLAESLFTPEAVARIKQSALANGVPADQIETLYAQAKAALGPLPQSTPQQAVAGSVEQVLTASGVSAAIPLSYTRDRIFAIRDEALRRGVGIDQVVRLVREEVLRRVGQTDSNPYGDLESLAQQLGSPVAPAYQAPPVFQAPQQPPVLQQPQPVVQAQQPFDRQDRRRRAPQQVQAPMPKWVVPAAAAVGGGVVILLIANLLKK